MISYYKHDVRKILQGHQMASGGAASEQPAKQDLDIREASRCQHSVLGWEPSPGPPCPFCFWFMMLLTLSWVGRGLSSWPWQPDAGWWSGLPSHLLHFPARSSFPFFQLRLDNRMPDLLHVSCLKLLFHGRHPECSPDSASCLAPPHRKVYIFTIKIKSSTL